MKRPDEHYVRVPIKSHKKLENTPKKCSKNIIIRISLMLFIILFLLSLTVFILIPVFFMFSPDFERLLMFTNVGLPTDSKAFERNLSGLRNFHLKFYDDGVPIALGVWHILPYALWNSTKNSTIDFDKALAESNYSIVVHFHGSGETRIDSIPMFDVLCNFFHIIAFDYRDFGDSTPALLSENAIAKDSLNIFKWIRERSDKDIFVWGHSLGSSLGTLTASQLKTSGFIPAGLILEAPFTSMREEIPVHPWGRIFSWLPYLNQTILNPLERNGFIFDTSQYILKVDCPIMILHAEDDSIIPFRLGKKLATETSQHRKSLQGPVFFHPFPAHCGFDHFRIYESKKLPEYIMNFTRICEVEKY